MAKIVVYTMAYRGDIFPFVPIASELARRGHAVTFVGPEELRDEFRSEPFAFVDSDCGDLTPTKLDSHGDYIRRWGRVLSGGMLLRLYFGRLTIPRLPELFAAIDDAIDGADLLVSHPAASLVGRMACERRDVPWVVGDLFPMLTPTRTRAPAMLRIPPPRGPLSRAAVALAWRFASSRLARRLCTAASTERMPSRSHRRHADRRPGPPASRVNPGGARSRNRDLRRSTWSRSPAPCRCARARGALS